MSSSTESESAVAGNGQLISSQQETYEGSWWKQWFSWRPTSEKALERAEQRVLRYVGSKISGRYVPIDQGNRIWTLEIAGEQHRKTPLVLVHGFGAGAGIWAMNYDAFARKQRVYAIDLLGFGRSSRPTFPEDGAEAESQFVESIEKWRKQMNLEQFILLGHSLGGYLVCSYAIRYPQHVKHLILADPWGMNEKPAPGDEQFTIPRWAKVVAAILSPFNPLSGVRAAGPLGPAMIRKFRPDLQKKFTRIFPDESDDTVLNYIYHCNAQDPSGETAFKTMTIPYGWAKYPMIHRIKDVDHKVPITFIYGSRTWMDSTAGYNAKHLREGAHVNVHIVKGAGHHVYADQPEYFNWVVTRTCDEVSKEDGEEDVDLDKGPPPIEVEKEIAFWES